MNSLAEQLIKYRQKNPNQWAKNIDDKKLLKALLEYDLYTNLSIPEKAAAIIYNGVPLCECGNSVKFSSKLKHITPFGGWLEFCSTKCAKSSKSTIEKRKQTNLKRYGTTSWAQSDVGRAVLSEKWSEEKKQKFSEALKKTYNQKYGVDFYSQTQEYLDKRTNTILEKTGGKYTNYFQDLEKIKASNLEKYGVSHYNKTDQARLNLSINNGMKNSIIANKSKLNRMLSNSPYSKELINIIYEEKEQEFKKYIAQLNLEFRQDIAKHLHISYSFLNALFRKFNMTNDYLNKTKGNSYLEEEIYQYIKTLGMEVKRSDRTILRGKEIDLIIEQKKLGIEFNGLYYHSVFNGGKDINYHLDKTELAEANGYQLLHIFENEWQDPIKKNIWKSIIKSKLGLTPNIVYARKCKLKTISNSEAKEFFDNNHLSGHVNAQCYLGLYYNTILVSAISYGQSRFNKNETEIYRFASLCNYQVIGAFGKFFKVVPKENLISFADRRISGLNSVYTKFFNTREKTSPNWWGFYMGDYNLKHRLSYTKHKVKALIGKSYDDSISVLDNMFNNKYDIIYDSGNYKFSNPKQ
jgi:hypothetical protein